MEILIDGTPAALKKGTSFQFITENRYFTGSDSYTLNITFPLKDCPQNLKIFGSIARKDVSKEKITFDCEIRDKDFDKFGTITITELSENELKTQFLEGKSEQNFTDTFDEIYINELDLGTPSSTLISQSPDDVWATCDTENNYVALPWVNNTSGNIQNKADYNEDTDSYSWNADTKGLSFQPYLTFILHQLATTLGYTIDISSLEDSAYGYLIICNTLPYSWGMPEFAKALPHWTVTEFLEQLEYLLNGEFNIDYRNKTISFSFTKNVLSTTSPVKLENIVDSYTTEISSTDDQCEYQEAANISYAECDHEKWKFYDCPWLIKAFQHYTYTYGRSGALVKEESRVIEYESFSDLITAAKACQTINSFSGRTSTSITDRILYAKDIDSYFTFYTLSYEVSDAVRGVRTITYHLCLIPINSFGERIYKEDNDNSIEIKMVPAWIDYTDETYGDILFLECGELDNTTEAELIETSRGVRSYLQPQAVRTCQAGETKKSEEYFDKIYWAFWDGSHTSNTPTFLPRPSIDTLTIRPDFSYNYVKLRNLRLRDKTSANAPRPEFYRINTKQRFIFTWIGKNIPNVRSLYFINGKRYLCEKIQTTFTEQGRSELLKGYFYEVIS